MVGVWVVWRKGMESKRNDEEDIGTMRSKRGAMRSLG
jgi:hypothetical protein